MSAATGAAGRAVAALRRRRGRTLAAALAGVVCVVLVAGAAVYAWRLEQSYARAKTSADAVQTRFSATDGQGLNSGELDALNADLGALQSDLDDLNGRLNAPVLGALARNAPLLAPKVEATQQLLDVGLRFTSIARDGTALALEIRDAFEQTGFSTSNANPGPTWLDVVRANRAQIDGLQARFDAAVAERDGLDESQLPSRGRNALATVDKLIARSARIRADYVSVIPLLDRALGAEQDARYFVLLQNAEEIRPGGGFPGTSALITIRDGRLADIQIQSTVKLDQAYLANRTTVLPAPGPIREYLKQEEWLPHDAIWSPDFPTAARDFLRMYDASGWPPLQGVVALDYSAVQDVLALIAPYDVDVQGETATVSADNFIALIEEFRETNQHKKVVGVLGNSLIDRLKGVDFNTKKQVFTALRASADTREIQAYMLDPAMQAQVVARGWDGALDARPGTPTLAMTIASLAGGKSSTNIYAKSDLALSSSGPAGITHVVWTIELQNRGDPNGDQKYNGFHRTWLSLYLPEGATLTSSSLAPDPQTITQDPRALGYNVPMLTGSTTTLVVEFDAPTPLGQLLLRRQPGANNVKYAILGTVGGCAFDASRFLKQDLLLDATDCSARAAR